MSIVLYPEYCLQCARMMTGADCLCGANYGQALKKKVKKRRKTDLPGVREALPNHIAKDRRKA